MNSLDVMKWNPMKNAWEVQIDWFILFDWSMCDESNGTEWTKWMSSIWERAKDQSNGRLSMVTGPVNEEWIAGRSIRNMQNVLVSHTNLVATNFPQEPKCIRKAINQIGNPLALLPPCSWRFKSKLLFQ